MSLLTGAGRQGMEFFSPRKNPSNRDLQGRSPSPLSPPTRGSDFPRLGRTEDSGPLPEFVHSAPRNTAQTNGLERLKPPSHPDDIENFLQTDLATRCPTLVSLLKPGESIGQMFLRVTGKPLIITIDGFSSTGKGTVARRLGHYYGLEDTSSGSAYRAIAFAAKQEIPSIKNRPWSTRRKEASSPDELPLNDNEIKAIEALALRLVENGELRFIHYEEGSRIVLKQDGKESDVTKELHSLDCSDGASLIAKLPKVREALLPFLRSFGQKGWVMDGRDMGTIVFPDAPIKFFFGDESEGQFESLLSRAIWRVEQRQNNSTVETEEEMMVRDEELGLSQEDIKELSEEDLETLRFAILVSRQGLSLLDRDHRDTNRAVSRLERAPDAIRFSSILPADYVEDETSPFYVPKEERVYRNERGSLELQSPERFNGLIVLPEFEAFDRVRRLADQKIEEILRAHVEAHGMPD